MKGSKDKLTAGRVAKFECEPGKGQSFLWDSSAPGLAVRATQSGSKAYIFQSRIKSGDVVRLTIGPCKSWVLEEERDANGVIILPGARQEAARLQAIIDQGRDPRQARADIAADDKAKRQATEDAAKAAEDADRRGRVTLAEAWSAYIAEKSDEADRAKASKGTIKAWGERHFLDHEKLMRPKRAKEGGAVTLQAGALASLAGLPLSEINPAKIKAWLELEAVNRPTQAALAFRLLRAFLNWCDSQDDYKGIAAADACAASDVRKRVPQSKAKDDCLQKGQLSLWFERVLQLQNKRVAGYLQGMLITGARPNELSALRWADVNFDWNYLRLRDKVEGNRDIPLTPYFKRILQELRTINETPPPAYRILQGRKIANDLGGWKPSEFVFASGRSESGRIESAGAIHRELLKVAAIPNVTLHGLRRSFGTLAEWVECPAGISAQIMGHKPSATAEKHYRARPLDLLTLWHSKIEAFLLTEAGVALLPAVQEAPEAAPDNVIHLPIAANG